MKRNKKVYIDKKLIVILFIFIILLSCTYFFILKNKINISSRNINKQNIVMENNDINKENKTKNIVNEQSKPTKGIQYTANNLTIMGYKTPNYAQIMSYILTRAQSSYGIDKIMLQGNTLEDHLKNTDKISKEINIDPLIIISQQIVETATFMYQYESSDGNVIFSSVRPSDYNFAGMGATDSNPQPCKYKNDYEGQLAQAEHLQAYASKDELSIDIVDVRYKYVNRGVAPTVNELSKKWASDESYGEKITKIYNEIISHETNIELVKENIGNLYADMNIYVSAGK